MKKLALALVVIVMIMSLSTVSVSAAAQELLKGTPVVDGVLDDIYTQSYSFTVNTSNQVYAAGADYADTPELSGTTYLLWDDTFVYVCTVVTDATILSAGQSTLDSNGSYTWMNDVVEMWFSFDEGTTWGQFNQDAYGLQMGMSESFGLIKDDGYNAAAKINGDTYVIEAQFPHYSLKAGDTFYYNTQINNILAEDASKIVCIGAQRVENIFTVSANEVSYPVIIEEVEEEAPAVEVAPVEAAAEAPAATTAAQTADITILAAVIALGISAVVAKKTKR